MNSWSSDLKSQICIQMAVQTFLYLWLYDINWSLPVWDMTELRSTNVDSIGKKGKKIGGKGLQHWRTPSFSLEHLSHWCAYTIHWVWSQTAVPLEKGKKKGLLLLCRNQSSHASNIIAAAALLCFSHPPALRHVLMFYFHWLSLCINLKLIECV